MPVLDTYIFTSCTNPSLSAVTTTSSQTIVAIDNNPPYNVLGCYDNTLQTTLSADTVSELGTYTDCADCASGTTSFEFLGCCDGLTYFFLVPNSGVTAFTTGQVVSYNSTCYQVVAPSGSAVEALTGYTIYGNCTTCQLSNPCPSPTPTPTVTPTPIAGCKCLYVDSNVEIIATGNTDTSLNYNAVYQYYGCDGTPTSYTATTGHSAFYFCTSGGVMNDVSFYQDDILYSSGVITPPFGWNPPANNSVSASTFVSYNSICYGDPCGPDVTPTPTETPTPTVTPTVTRTPTVTMTPTVTPTVTPSNTTSPLPFDIYTFRDCCDSNNIFRFSFVPGSLTTGQVFNIDNSLDFSGCAEVLPYEATGPIYVGSSVIFTEQTSCSDALCPSCPTPTPTPVQYCSVCNNYAIYNDNTVSVYVDYTDCLGNDESILIPEKTTIEVCACEDTIINPNGVYITLVGTCPQVTPTPQPTLTNTPTPSVTPTVGWNYCSVEEYCLLTYFPETEMYDGTYYSAGTYNSRTYYSGDTGFIYYGDLQWCLSETLGGDCILSGHYPYYGVCPDLCSELFSSGVCITTTSTTNPCNVFDFEAYFDCDITTTTTTIIPCSATSINATFSAYTTTTTTANLCIGVGGDITISGYTTTTTTAPTTTTTTTTRDVVVSGDVTYTLVETVFVCPGQTYWFQDCSTSENYYIEPSTAFNSIDLFINYVYNMSINNVVSCYTFLGTSTISPNAVFNSYTNWYLDCGTCQS